MTARKYKTEPKHRIKFTNLTEARISQKLKVSAKGPPCKSPFSASLAGTSLRVITDAAPTPEHPGPKLEYKFRSDSEMSVSINGAKAVKAGYGALELKKLMLISHMVPGTDKGYNVIIDRHTGLATVFETWFGAEFDPEINRREVQRQVYYGYIDDGSTAPGKRHHLTNRLEGKGIYWKQDNGVETLEFYCSIVSSIFLELTRTGGELAFCSPSDYIMINDHQFIYSRAEAELGGIFTLHVLDLHAMDQVGTRLGFDEQDELEYYMFRGKGKITGQIATFEEFGNNGEEIAYGDRQRPTEPGMRLVYRPLRTFPVMTDAEVKDQVLNHAHAFGDGEGSGAGGMGGYKTELVDELTGKSLKIRMDNGGPVIEYVFDELRKLRWRYEGDPGWRNAYYEAYEPDEELYFFAHFLDAEFPRSCAMVALDMKNGLSTLLKGTTGTPYRNNETHPTYYFGIFEMEGIIPPRYHRHGWTDELVGEAYTWNYQPGKGGLSSMHLYATPNTYSWTIFMPDGSLGMQWSSVAWYVKLRDDVYIMSWVEEACNGTLGVICFNRRTMHDAGFGYHVGPNGLSLSVIGARSRHAGKFDIEKYLGPKV